MNLLPSNVANGGEDGTITGSGYQSGAVISSTTEEFWQGSHSIKTITPGIGAGWEAYVSPYIDVTPSLTYTASVYIKGVPGVQVRLAIYERAARPAMTIITSTNTLLTLDGTWQRHIATITFSNLGYVVNFKVYPAINTTATTFYLDGMQIEAGSVATAWEDPAGTPILPVLPVADFTATPLSGYAPLEVQFTDTSTGSPTSWFWDFGNGTTSTLQNPLYTYPTAGSFTPCLTVTNANGSDQGCLTTPITVFIFQTSITILQTSITITDVIATPDNVNVGDTVNVSISYTNDGAAGSKTVTISLGGLQVYSGVHLFNAGGGTLPVIQITIPNLDPGTYGNLCPLIT